MSSSWRTEGSRVASRRSEPQERASDSWLLRAWRQLLFTEFLQPRANHGLGKWGTAQESNRSILDVPGWLQSLRAPMGDGGRVRISQPHRTQAHCRAYRVTQYAV